MPQYTMLLCVIPEVCLAMPKHRACTPQNFTTAVWHHKLALFLVLSDNFAHKWCKRIWVPADQASQMQLISGNSSPPSQQLVLVLVFFLISSKGIHERKWEWWGSLLQAHAKRMYRLLIFAGTPCETNVVWEGVLVLWVSESSVLIQVSVKIWKEPSYWGESLPSAQS